MRQNRELNHELRIRGTDYVIFRCENYLFDYDNVRLSYCV